MKKEIERKIEYALAHRDSVDIAVIAERLKPHLRKLEELKADSEREVRFLTEECKKAGLWFREYDSGDKISKEVNRSEVETISEKVIVQLQYSKEPDFLKLIDSLVTKEVPLQVGNVTRLFKKAV